MNINNFVRLLKYKTTHLVIYNRYNEVIYDDVVGAFLTSVIRERIAKEEIYYINVDENEFEDSGKIIDVLHIHLFMC